MCDDARAVDERSEGSSKFREDESEKKSSRRKGESTEHEMPPVNVELPDSGSSTPPSALSPRHDSLPRREFEERREKELEERPKSKHREEPWPGPIDSPDASTTGPSLEMGSRGHVRMAMAVAAPAETGVAFEPKGDSQYVASIGLNRSLTGGINLGEGDGSQGLQVVVEPRDSHGRPLDAPAQVEVALLDPAEKDAEGNAARLALWNFTDAETASMFRRVGSSAGIHLGMAWPDEPPKHEHLHLFVRYVTADGRTLEAHHPIDVTLSIDKTAHRNPADSHAEVERPEPFGAEADAMLPSEPPVESHRAEPIHHVASRNSDPDLRRPVWSPERR